MRRMVAVAAALAGISCGGSGLAPLTQDDSGNFTGLWAGTAVATVSGQPGTPVAAEMEITRLDSNKLGLSDICPDGSGATATVTAPASFAVDRLVCPPISESGCSAVTIVLNGTGTLASGTLTIDFAGSESGCGQSYSFQLTFTAQPGSPVPGIATLSPSSAVEGGPAFTLTVTGSDFVSGAFVEWNGSPRATTFVSSTELQAAIGAADIATGGSVSVTVTNPPPGGGTSSALAFDVVIPNPVPAIESIVPALAPAGGLGFMLTVVGSGFSTSTVVQWNGDPRATTVVSSSELHAAILASDIASAGSAAVTVYTPPPGGGTASGPAFAIASPAGTASQALAFHVDTAHSGYATFGRPLAFPATSAWTVQLPGAVSYPLIAGGKVFVLTAGSASGGQGTQLFALDESTGKTVWGPVAIGGTYWVSGHTYDSGKVFVLNFDGLLLSFDAATGEPGWSALLPNQYVFESPPTASAGIVYVAGAGSGGTVYAVDETNGNVLWSNLVNGDQSSPTVSIDGVFVSYTCQVYKFDLATGSILWHYAGPGDGGGGTTAAYANGSLYVRDPACAPAAGTIFDAASGNQTGTFPMSSVSAIPAFSSTAAFFLNDGTLRGMDFAAQQVSWSFAGDGHLVSAPIAIDSVVVAGSASGTVYALDAATGRELWSGAAGAAISPTEELGILAPKTGIGAGEGFLVVPAGQTLTAWYLLGQ